MGKTPSHKKQSKSLKKKRKDKARAKKNKQIKEQNKAAEKEMQKRLNVIQDILAQIPTTCTSCDEEFDNTNDDHLDNWQFSYHETGVELPCLECREKEHDRA